MAAQAGWFDSIISHHFVLCSGMTIPSYYQNPGGGWILSARGEWVIHPVVACSLGRKGLVLNEIIMTASEVHLRNILYWDINPREKMLDAFDYLERIKRRAYEQGREDSGMYFPDNRDMHNKGDKVKKLVKVEDVHSACLAAIRSAGFLPLAPGKSNANGPDVWITRDSSAFSVEIKTCRVTQRNSIQVPPVEKNRRLDDFICIYHPSGYVLFEPMADHLRSCTKGGYRTLW